MAATTKNTMKTIDVIAAAILFIGGLNWGLIGLLGFNMVAWIFGEMSILTRFVYILVGISALYDAALWKTIQKRWECRGALDEPRQATA